MVLADQINGIETDVDVLFTTIIERGWQIGEILEVIKDNLQYGQYKIFVEENLNPSYRQCRKYTLLYSTHPKGLPKDFHKITFNHPLGNLPEPEEEEKAGPKAVPDPEPKPPEPKNGPVEDVPIDEYEEACKQAQYDNAFPAPTVIEEALKTLGISPLTAETLAVIKKGLSSLYHPDKGGDTAKAAAINNACDILKDIAI